MSPNLDQVQQVVSDVLAVPLESIRPDSTPDTLDGWDSLQHLNLVLALEQAFGVQFTPEEIEQLLSPELISALLVEKLKSCEVT